MCKNCAFESGQYIKINHKVKEFLYDLSKTQISEKSKYDELVNYSFLDKCFQFMKKYIENISHKKTKVFEVMDNIRNIWKKF